MDVVDLFWHLAGLLAPALVLARCVVGVSLLLWGHAAPALGVPAQVAINFVVCVAVLLGGLMLAGHDGRMTTYGVLVLASAVCQVALMGRGRRT